jgi:hypothetical protein
MVETLSKTFPEEQTAYEIEPSTSTETRHEDTTVTRGDPEMVCTDAANVTTHSAAQESYVKVRHGYLF